MNNDLLTLARTYPEYKSLMNIARIIRENNLANNFNYNDIEILQDVLLEKVIIENLLGCPINVLIRALSDGIWIKDYRTNEIYYVSPNCFDFRHYSSKGNKLHLSFNIHLERRMYCYHLKDYKKTWWTKEDLSE